jgi:hypothetical protein
MVTPPNSQAKNASPAKCAADVRNLCATDSFAQQYAMVYTFAPGKPVLRCSYGATLTLPAFVDGYFPQSSADGKHVAQ